MGTAEEMEAGRKRSQYFASLGATRPQPKPDLSDQGSGIATKNDGTTNVIPFGPTGNTDAQSSGTGTGPTENTGPTGNTRPTDTQSRPNAGQAGDSAANLATPRHDKAMASRFLAGLDPNATRFTFQFFNDSGVRYAQIIHGSLDEVWPKVQALNTPKRGVGVFVTINETDFKGRSSKNIVRARALFVDADSVEQGQRCLEAFTACSAPPSMAVKSGRGRHFYFCTDVPRDQFSALQRCLIDKVGTDAAVKDLPRVLRLPGSLYLKNPSEPRLVKLLNPTNCAVQRWQLSELVAKLGLSRPSPVPNQGPSNTANLTPAKHDLSNFKDADRERLQKLFGLPVESLSAGLEANVEEIRSAVSAIPPSAIATEPEWMRLARALAHEAAVFNKPQAEQLWEILDLASRTAPGYDEADNRNRWLRYIDEALDRENPITIDTVFHMALDHGWRGWSPQVTATSGPAAWSAADLHVSFSNIPHRRWLYGVDLVRGDITLIGSPGGAGKTSLAIGMAVSIAVGRPLLDEKIFGGEGLKALYINAEDSGIEMKRRTWALCLKHNIAEKDLSRFYVAGTDDPRVQRLSFLRTIEKSSSVVDQKGFEQLEGLIAALQPDLLVLDPLVALCGGGNINDNAAMSLVMRNLKRLAIKHDCAVLIVHHTRKGGDLTNAEAISGASAIVNLARRAIMPVTMAVEESNQHAGVLPSERFRYFKVIDAKSNLAPRSGDTPWYELCSVELPNAAPPIYPYGDHVQAIARVNLPLLNNAAATADDQKITRAILDVVDRGKMIDGQAYPYSPSLAGARNERSLLDDAMAAVASATVPRQWHPGDLKATTERAIGKMKDGGLLVEGQMSNTGRFRRARALRVDRSRMPSPPVPSADGSAALGNPAAPGKECLPNPANENGGQLVNPRSID